MCTKSSSDGFGRRSNMSDFFRVSGDTGEKKIDGEGKSKKALYHIATEIQKKWLSMFKKKKFINSGTYGRGSRDRFWSVDILARW